MAAKLTLRYDKVGDILYIDKRMPYKEQESDEIGEEIFARFNPETGEIENIEVMWFSTRLLDESVDASVLELPILADLRLST